MTKSILVRGNVSTDLNKNKMSFATLWLIIFDTNYRWKPLKVGKQTNERGFLVDLQSDDQNTTFFGKLRVEKKSFQNGYSLLVLEEKNHLYFLDSYIYTIQLLTYTYTLLCIQNMGIWNWTKINTNCRLRIESKRKTFKTPPGIIRSTYYTFYTLESKMDCWKNN